MSTETSNFSENEFLSFQGEALDYLYNIMPVANDSLFIADMSDVANSRFRVKKISIPSPEIEFEYNEAQRMSFPKKVKYNPTFTVEWYEDAFDSVTKFHLNKMNSLVNLNTGLFSVGVGDSTVKFTINKYTFVEGNSESSTPFDSLPLPAPTAVLTVDKALVSSVGEISFDSTAGGSIKTVSITYQSIGKIRWESIDDMSSILSSDFSTANKNFYLY